MAINCNLAQTDAQNNQSVRVADVLKKTIKKMAAGVCSCTCCKGGWGKGWKKKTDGISAVKRASSDPLALVCF